MSGTFGASTFGPRTFGSNTFNLPAPAVKPTITTTTLPDGTTGVAYNKQLTATGDAPITWSVVSGTLPAGLTLSATGLLSGTTNAAGTSNFTIRATNAAGDSPDKAYTLTVTAAAVAPVITTTTLPGGTANTAYSQTIAATGTAPITFSVASGTLPAGLSLSAAGVLSGTPSAAGSSSFTIRATNAAGFDDQAYTLAISAGTVKPTITTTTLYAGTVNSAYSTAFHATGTAPITWSVAAGTLPPGLSLASDGSVTGTPTTAGSYSFTVKATNVAGEAQSLVTVRVNAASALPPTINVPYAQRPATLDGCWASWSEQQQTNMLRTQMDSGAIKVRRRTTGITRIAQVSVTLPATKYADFMKWFNTDCQQGVMPTLMCTPQCNEEVWRFVNPPSISWVTKNAFTASCEIERLPGW